VLSPLPVAEDIGFISADADWQRFENRPKIMLAFFRISNTLTLSKPEIEGSFLFHVAL